MAKSKDEAPALIPVGRAAPSITLPDQTGRRRQLREHRGGWVVLYFYPKDNTSGCTREACQFRDELPRFRRSAVTVFGISPDDAASHLKFIADHDLTFDLLADVDRKVCGRYGVWQKKSMYGRSYMGVVRTTYLVDPAGRVADRWDKVKVAGHAAAVLARLGELS